MRWRLELFIHEHGDAGDEQPTGERDGRGADNRFDTRCRCHARGQRDGRDEVPSGATVEVTGIVGVVNLAGNGIEIKHLSGVAVTQISVDGSTIIRKAGGGNIKFSEIQDVGPNHRAGRAERPAGRAGRHADHGAGRGAGRAPGG